MVLSKKIETLESKIIIHQVNNKLHEWFYRRRLRPFKNVVNIGSFKWLHEWFYRRSLRLMLLASIFISPCIVTRMVLSKKIETLLDSDRDILLQVLHEWFYRRRLRHEIVFCYHDNSCSYTNACPTASLRACGVLSKKIETVIVFTMKDLGIVTRMVLSKKIETRIASCGFTLQLMFQECLSRSELA